MSHEFLQIKNVKKIFGKNGKISVEALKGISIDIFSGEIITLLGVNGAGKSTLSSIIATVHPPTQGDILFNNVSIYDDIINYRMHVGYCPQKSNFDNSLTVGQNLYFAGKFYGLSDDVVEKRLQLLVDQFGLIDCVNRFSDSLSGGYKQRCMIARSLIHKPSIVLLDEPTVGLDPQIRRQLWAKILELKKEGITIILTTHYLDEAEQLSDRVCIIDKGFIKLIDTPKNLLNDFKRKNLEDVFIDLMQEGKEDLCSK